MEPGGRIQAVLEILDEVAGRDGLRPQDPLEVPVVRGAGQGKAFGGTELTVQVQSWATTLSGRFPVGALHVSNAAWGSLLGDTTTLVATKETKDEKSIDHRDLPRLDICSCIMCSQ